MKEKKALIKSINKVDKLIDNAEKIINNFDKKGEVVPVWIEAYIHTLESLEHQLLTELHQLEKEELKNSWD